MPINTQTIGYRDGDTELTGLLAWDASRDYQRPGILVVHGGAGLDDHADAWTEADIKARSNELTNVIAQVWPFGP